MESYINQHVEVIYRHCHRRLGAKDSLYIITGCIKTDLWALAAYQEMEGDGSHHNRLLQLSRAAASVPNRPSSAYHWTQQPAATYPNHDDSGVEGLKNQSLFLQGFKLAFSDQYVSRMKEALSASSGNRSTPAARQDSDGQPEDAGAGSGGSGEEDPSQSGGCEPSEGDSMTRSLPMHESATPSRETFDEMDQSDHPLSAGRCSRHEEATGLDGWEYSHFPAPSGDVSASLWLERIVRLTNTHYPAAPSF